MVCRALPNAQVIMLSATFPEHVIGMAEEVAPNANVITIPKEEVTVKDIKQLYMVTHDFNQKIDALVAIYENLNLKQAIVFCNTKKGVEMVTEQMRGEGLRVCAITGNLTKSEQLHQLDRFLSGQDQLLVSTDMLSRGIDIPQVLCRSQRERERERERERDRERQRGTERQRETERECVCVSESE